MKIDRTVNKWFEETLTQIKANVRQIRQLDCLLIGVLHCARKYCNGIMLLLNNEHKMPAAALLRILCELYANLLWCFKVSDREGKAADDNAIYKRFRRWDYKGVIEHEKMLGNVSKVASGDYKQEIDKALNELEKGKAEFKNQCIRCMPDTAGIFRELRKDWVAEVYPRIYQYYSGAIHWDMKLIREMVQYHDHGGKIRCFSDPPSYKTSELLLYCISIGCDINRLLRRHYGFDSEQMQTEYESLSNGLQSRR